VETRTTGMFKSLWSIKCPNMRNKIIGVENIKDIDFFEDEIQIKVYLKYPDYDDILNIEPKERIKVIRKRKKEIYFNALTQLQSENFKRIGEKNSPSGFEIKCDKVELLKLNKSKEVERIILCKQEDEYISALHNVEKYFAVIARFVIQIENRIKGLQDYEDRTLLIKARSGDEAEEKLKKSFKDYEKPYLNPYGELVRWKFEEFIDWYETSYDSIESMLDDDSEGIEIFSRLKSRRFNSERAWKREI